MPPEPVPLLVPPVNRAAYSDRSAWIMARCSQLAYFQFEKNEEPKLRDSLNELRLDLSTTFNDEGTQAFLATNKRYAVLVFRGTEKDMQDICADINIRFYRDKSGARISTGFRQAYARVEKQVTDAIAKIDHELPLYVTGHSLGGALAAIASARIRPSDRVAACYTFGCPRVGDTEFSEQLWKVPVYRLVHASDIVPRLPFAFGYRHAGDLRYIKRSGELIESPNSLGTFLAFAYTVTTGAKKVFENHRVAGYTENLQAWALKRLELEKDSTSMQAPESRKTFSASPGAAH